MEQTGSKLISIIIPVYNGEKTLRRTLLSCLEQTYTNVEILVVDNASTDGTKNVVASLQTDSIRYIHLTQKGRSLARNTGIEASKGAYIVFLDADDLLEKNMLSTMTGILEKNHARAVQCATLYMRGDEIVKKMYPHNDTETFYWQLMTGNTIPSNSVLMDRSICKKFPEGMEYCEDWVFWLESLRNIPVVAAHDYFGAIVLLHDGNTMLDFRRMKDYELRVLLQYKKEKLPMRYAFARAKKIYKRYLEYRVCAPETDSVIETYAKGSLACAIIRGIAKLRVVQKAVNKIAAEKNREQF